MAIVLLDDELPSLFPDPSTADPTGLLAVSKTLGEQRLIAAYQQGIFPWMKIPEDPFFWCWYSPDPRMLLYPGEFKISRSLHKVLKEERFDVRIDQAYSEVMKACADAPRPNQESTWIHKDMQIDYTKLHNLGIAHSIEAYEQDELVGGLYGLALGRAFFGESMFHRKPEASKVCMARLVEIAKEAGFLFIDCQVPNPFLHSLGAREVTRDKFLHQLREAHPEEPSPAHWLSLSKK